MVLCGVFKTDDKVKAFYKELLFTEIEQDENNNIFTNYNNYLRDEYVAEQTFEKCWSLIKELNAQARLFKHQRDAATKSS